MMGEIAGIGAALCWAGGTLIIKPLTTKFGSLSLNCLRILAGWIFLMVILSPFGKVAEIGLVPGYSVAYLIGSGVIGLSIGTTLFIKSMSLTDITKVYPASYSFWLLGTVAIAAIFLGEAITSYTILGAVLIVSGIVLLVRPARGQRMANTASDIHHSSGIALAIGAGVCWAVGSTLVKIGLSGASPAVVNMLRLPAVALVLIALIAWRENLTTFSKYDWKSVFQIGGAGILEQGVGAILWFTSIELIGVAKATILTNTSPLFVVPFAVVFLKEKVTLRVVLGTVFCVFGIWLTIL